ncbi:MAG: transposase [Streptosporangiaceae bacterium]
MKGTNSKSRLWLARRMTEDLAEALPGRTICVIGDAAYAGKELRALPGTVTWTTRLRKDAALHDIALVTTDLDASPAAVIERYAARWSVEVAIEDAKQVFGAGQARNRTARAVRATVPFILACQSLAILWYATAGHDPADVDEHRARAPWYAAKTEPSTADMTAKLRLVLIAAKFRLPRPDQLTPAEISTIRLAWETPAA